MFMRNDMKIKKIIFTILFTFICFAGSAFANSKKPLFLNPAANLRGKCAMFLRSKEKITIFVKKVGRCR